MRDERTIKLLCIHQGRLVLNFKHLEIFTKPIYILILYVILVFSFAFIYWLNPNFWDEPLSFIKSFYFSVITITTLGYGDITPKSDSAMLLTSVEALLGIFVIGIYLNAIAHNFSKNETLRHKKLEDEKWKPARLMVARHTCRVHQMVFAAFKYIIDVNNQTNLKSHGFPAGTTQRQANAWAKDHAIKPFDYHYEELKKMVEYNNIALDAELQPMIIHYIVAVGNLINTCKFVVDAYKGENAGSYHGSFNYTEAKEMHTIYSDLLAVFPEISNLEKPITPLPVPAEEILPLVKESNEKCTFLELRIVEKDT
ncbi:MAG: hypothetical protein ACI92T_003149 [Pseudoalteromonas distincta]|jgi:hypothetical protein